tara:strand:- start:130 stop:426 length:297 start_codon:yes stop_codon:yes gene_type:complete
MNEERLTQILVEPKVSEKATRLTDLHRQYVFKVISDATKPEIKSAVELLFKVEVDSVTTSIVRAKQRNFRGSAGTKKSWKKAFVRLREGFEIDFLAAE